VIDVRDRHRQILAFSELQQCNIIRVNLAIAKKASSASVVQIASFEFRCVWMVSSEPLELVRGAGLARKMMPIGLGVGSIGSQRAAAEPYLTTLKQARIAGSFSLVE